MNPVAELKIDDVLDEVLSRYSRESASLISVLQDLQKELNYLPREALEGAARVLGVARSQVYHIATFFPIRRRGETAPQRQMMNRKQ